MLTGYQAGRKEKEKFLARWHGSLKERFRDNPEARAFTWVDADEDEIAGRWGYFKPVEGTACQAIDPSKIEVFRDYFYWGYWSDH
ncbi:MAG: hypothetical protein AAB225_27830 [Acidobacteriota bacterium]